jgi:FkbM family methyltransferase
MIKFSTKTNYTLVSAAQRVLFFFLSFFINDFTRVLVRRNGIIWNLNLEEVIDFLIFISGDFDRDGVRQFSKRISAEDYIIDIGANIGSFCLPVSKMLTNGKIWAIEPSDYAFSKLNKNVHLNMDLEGKISIHQGFITQKTKSKPDMVFASWNSQKDKERHENHQGIATSTDGAESWSLDDFVRSKMIRKVDWIKIDVDGFEKDVLFGSEEVIVKHQPKIFMELCEYSLQENNTSVEEILQWLENKKYVFYSQKGKPFKSITEIKSTIPDMGTTNIFAYPKE